MLYSKALCKYYKLDSDFINLVFIMKHVFSILKRTCTNTYKLTIHIYGIHNDITKHKQPEATVIKVNLNDSHCKFESKKSI